MAIFLCVSPRFIAANSVSRPALNFHHAKLEGTLLANHSYKACLSFLAQLVGLTLKTSLYIYSLLEHLTR